MAPGNTPTNTPIYRRVLLKLSGEFLLGDTAYGIDGKVLRRLAVDIGALITAGVEVAIVVGGGNLFRGETLAQTGINRITADQIGMLGTIMNALALRDALIKAEVKVHILSALPMLGVVDAYDRHKAMQHLSRKEVVIFAAGTGNPLVTTDSAASLRAVEIEAEILLKATQVDGIYSENPSLNAQAKRYQYLSYCDALAQECAVMDWNAFRQCRDHDMQIRVFNLNKKDVLLNIVLGIDEGTLVGRGISA